MSTWEVLLQYTIEKGMILAILTLKTSRTGWLMVSALHIPLELIHQNASKFEQEAEHFVAKLAT